MKTAVFGSPFYNDFYIKVISGVMEEIASHDYKCRLLWFKQEKGIMSIVNDIKSFKLGGAIVSTRGA